MSNNTMNGYSGPAGSEAVASDLIGGAVNQVQLNGGASATELSASSRLWFDDANGKLYVSGSTNATIGVFTHLTGTNALITNLTGTNVKANALGSNTTPLSITSSPLLVTGTLDVNGGLINKITAVTGNYTVLSTDCILALSSATSLTCTLPATAPIGTRYTFIDKKGNCGSVNHEISASFNIEDSWTKKMDVNFQSIIFINLGT